jgi:hypothetical protein
VKPSTPNTPSSASAGGTGSKSKAGAKSNRIAVYVASSDLNIDQKKALETRLLNDLVKSGRFVAIERSASFHSAVDRESHTQRSGMIDYRQISVLSGQFGAEFVCIAEVNSAFGEYLVS